MERRLDWLRTWSFAWRGFREDGDEDDLDGSLFIESFRSSLLQLIKIL